MTFSETHGRFGSFVDAVQAGYPLTGTSADPAWYVGAEHLAAHDNWNRIVAWHTEARILSPDRGAISRTDRVVARRVLRVHVSVWSKDARRAENACHALHVAIDGASGESNNVVGDVREQWFPGSIEHGGASFDLSFDLAINVLASDLEVIASDAEPGAGTPVTPATELVIGSQLDDQALPDVSLSNED